MISLHPLVKSEDAPKLNEYEQKQIVAAAKRIESGNSRLDDIVELDSYPGLFRWKPDKEIIRETDCNVRMVYRITPKGLEILAATQRKDAYLLSLLSSRL